MKRVWAEIKFKIGCALGLVHLPHLKTTWEMHNECIRLRQENNAMKQYIAYLQDLYTSEPTWKFNERLNFELTKKIRH
jgi:hypothetical protein